MLENGMSPADIAAMMGNRDCDDYGMNGWLNNPFIYLVFMWMFRSFNNGWDNNGNAALQGALTRGELYDGLNYQSIDNQLDNIAQSLCQGFNSVNTSNLQSFNTTNTNMLQGFNNANIANLQGFNQVGRDLCSGFNGVQSALAQLGYNQQECCCRTNQNLEALKAENYRNTCEITTAIHQEGELTRGLITQNTIQDLRDRLADRDRDLVEANSQISQFNQTQYLVNILKPRAIPSYSVCNSQGGCGGTYNTYNG